MKTETAIPTLSPLEILLQNTAKTMVTFPCGIWQKAVAKRHKAICCDLCDKWIRIACNNFDKKNIQKPPVSEISWSACPV